MVVGGSFFFLAPKAPQEEVRAHKWKGNLTVLSGDKSDGHMSGYCLVVVYSCTYSLDKFHCQWYKTPNGTGILKEKQESILTCVWNAVVLPRKDPKVVQNSHLHPSTCKKIRCSSWPVTRCMNDAYPQYLSPQEMQKRQNSSVQLRGLSLLFEWIVTHKRSATSIHCLSRNAAWCVQHAAADLWTSC